MTPQIIFYSPTRVPTSSIIHNQLQDFGINRNQVWIDPGFGFAKTPQQNYILLQNLDQLAQLGFPILVGLSRKRMLRELVGQEDKALQAASVSAALLAYEKGARIFRVHDVRDTVLAFRFLDKNF